MLQARNSFKKCHRLRPHGVIAAEEYFAVGGRVERHRVAFRIGEYRRVAGIDDLAQWNGQLIEVVAGVVPLAVGKFELLGAGQDHEHFAGFSRGGWHCAVGGGHGCQQRADRLQQVHRTPGSLLLSGHIARGAVECLRYLQHGAFSVSDRSDVANIESSWIPLSTPVSKLLPSQQHHPEAAPRCGASVRKRQQPFPAELFLSSGESFPAR